MGFWSWELIKCSARRRKKAAAKSQSIFCYGNCKRRNVCLSKLTNGKSSFFSCFAGVSLLNHFFFSGSTNNDLGRNINLKVLDLTSRFLFINLVFKQQWALEMDQRVPLCKKWCSRCHLVFDFSFIHAHVQAADSVFAKFSSQSMHVVGWWTN